ncbi:hypothetical protein G7Z17_g12181 [Cylindrodendrum hubeiense]|uniref:Uncharacterized protein n=1 Tax=Cylindrodendrum hubeiense TaxID=595255 RepID=A0A9P5H2H9_9HYPO|nr:hypothetical protein G7Z17_g12181 [Cylindrodendrum hubeiense]
MDDRWMGMKNRGRGVSGLAAQWLSLRQRDCQDKHGVSGVSDSGPSQGVSAGGGWMSKTVHSTVQLRPRPGERRAIN